MQWPCIWCDEGGCSPGIMCQFGRSGGHFTLNTGEITRTCSWHRPHRPRPAPPTTRSTAACILYLSGYIKLTGHMRGLESLGGGVRVCRQPDHLLRARAAQIPGNYLEQAQSTMLRMDHLDYREGLHRTNTAHHTTAVTQWQ